MVPTAEAATTTLDITVQQVQVVLVGQVDMLLTEILMYSGVRRVRAMVQSYKKDIKT
jgi:hypothetical protein